MQSEGKEEMEATTNEAYEHKLAFANRHDVILGVVQAGMHVSLISMRCFPELLPRSVCRFACLLLLWGGIRCLHDQTDHHGSPAMSRSNSLHTFMVSRFV